MDDASHCRLSHLASGRRARITSVQTDGPLGQRLLELGLLEGATITMVRRAPAGDPLEVRISGARLSLRVSEAEHILVEELP